MYTLKERFIFGISQPREIRRLELAAVLALIFFFTFQSITQAAGPGDLDTSFGLDGKVTTDFDEWERGEAVAVQPDGKIVVAGSTTADGSWDLLVTRYNQNGSLDPSFGNNGKIATDFGGNEMGSAVVVQPGDGKIVVLGYQWEENSDFVLARYNPDGSLDPTFGNGGKVQTEFGYDDYGLQLTLQPDGKIIAVGESYGGGAFFTIARYNSNGSLDSTFDSDGKILTDFGAVEGGSSVVTQPDGKIVVAGYTDINGSADFAIARYNMDGSLDFSFGDEGKVITNFRDFYGYLSTDIAREILLQPDGKIVVIGSANISQAWGLARYNTDGSLDLSFGDEGKVVADISSRFEESMSSATMQADGKIIVAGHSWDGSDKDFLLARFNSNGSFDTSFSQDGWTSTEFEQNDEITDVIIQSHKILAVGESGTGNSGDLALARYLSTPILSPSLSLTKTVQLSSEPLKPSDPLTYTIVVVNDGEGDANGVVVTDTLPAHLIGSDLNETVDISAGKRLTFTLNATLATDAPAGEIITNTAFFSHASASGQDSAAFKVGEANSDLEEKKIIYLPVVIKG